MAYDLDQFLADCRAALGRDPRELVAVLEESGLRGMGGAGFPTGRKWRFVAAEPATAKFVICNADESEPATFKDREILHDLSHLVIEGMALAAYCTGATRGFLFIRHEYAPERHRFEAALAEADLLITGEGAWDVTSGLGKITRVVLDRARVAGVPAILLTGRIEGPVPAGIQVISGGGSWLDPEAIARLIAENLRARG